MLFFLYLSVFCCYLWIIFITMSIYCHVIDFNFLIENCDFIDIFVFCSFFYVISFYLM